LSEGWSPAIQTTPWPSELLAGFATQQMWMDNKGRTCCCECTALSLLCKQQAQTFLQLHLHANHTACLQTHAVTQLQGQGQGGEEEW